jgi:protein-S-isoprenylcysteine O-methyltransferase Ste14
MLSITIGAVLVVIGELVRLWGVSYAGSETRTRSVGASQLVTQGPFAYTRNPLYMANIVIYFGFGIMANTFFPWLQLIGLAYFIFQYHFIIIEEEKHLDEKFGEKYANYRDSVSRLFPSLTPYDESKQSKIAFDLKAGYISEKRTLQANLTFLFCIYIIYILINQ